jgi:hypothetical protein
MKTAIVVAALLIPQQPAPLRDSCTGPAPDARLRLVLRMDKVFASGRQVGFSLVFKNVGTQEIALDGQLVYGHNLFIEVNGPDGLVPYSGTLIAIVHGAPKILRPGEELRREAKLHELGSLTFPELKPGQYGMVVCYKSVGVDRQCERGGDEPGLARVACALSNTASFRITGRAER